MQQRTRAFTLIELLVVIAIIALLISILLPALGRARLAGKLATSMSNQRQILTATNVYRTDSKGTPPFPLNYKRGGFKSATSGTLEGICTWSFGGKNCNTYWGNKPFDIESADRPLNPYMYPDIKPWAPDAPALLDKNAVDRVNLEMSGFRDPTDKVTHQRAWPAPTYGISCYDDVGSSYQSNLKWLFTDEVGKYWNGGQPVQAWELGMKYFRLGDTFYSSHFVLYNDEYADIIINNTNPKFVAINGYGDRNKSILGFMDNHCSYEPILSGGPTVPEAFFNTRYQMIFDPRTIKK